MANVKSFFREQCTSIFKDGGSRCNKREGTQWQVCA